MRITKLGKSYGIMLHAFWFKDRVGKKRALASQRNELSCSQEAAVNEVVSLRQGIPEEPVGYHEVFSSDGTHKKPPSRTS